MAIMHSTRREALLNRVEKPVMVKANLNLNFVESAGRLLRLSIARTGLSHKEAMDALAIEDKGQFSRMLDGKEKLWMHQLLRPEAAPIWKELIVLAAQGCGCTVERVVRIVESA